MGETPMLLALAGRKTLRALRDFVVQTESFETKLSVQ